MSLDRYKIISTIYNTLEDSLLLVKKKEDGKIYTIKSVRVDENSEKAKKLFFNELRILVPLTHKNIIMYKEAFFDKETKTLNMVIEYIDGGNLSMKLKLAKQKKIYLNEKVIWGIFIQILEGLDYLHSKFIIHRDLKTSNIYLTKKGVVKIAGLNVGKNIEEMGMALTQIGTPYFTAPEIWEQKAYDYKCDIWSLGCILYEMTSLQVPFLGLDMQELYQNITNLKYRPISKCYSKELREIIKIILNKNPIDRPSAKDLLNNKIILKKIQELNLNNDNKDQYTEINKKITKIIDDYKNNEIKLDNSHIIYKKSENKPVLHILKQRMSRIKKIQTNNNPNNDFLLDDVSNIRTKSDLNRNTYMNVNNIDKNLRDIKWKRIFKCNNSKNGKDPNYNKNILLTDYHCMKNNYSCSAINQCISPSFIFGHSAGKFTGKMKNKEMNNKNNNNNYFKLEIKKKNNSNLIKNDNYLNLYPNKIGINIQKIENNNNYNEDKNMINNKLLKKPNITNKIIIIKDNHNNLIKGFQKNKKVNIIINNDRNNNNILMNNIKNECKNDNIYKTNINEDKLKINTKKIIYRNSERYMMTNYNCKCNNINNKIYLNDNIKNSQNYNLVSHKYNNLINNKNERNIIKVGGETKIVNKKNGSFIEKNNLINIPRPFLKNKSNENYYEKKDIKKYNNIIKKISPQTKINELKENNNIINNQIDKNKKLIIKNLNINRGNIIFKLNKSPMIRRYIDHYFDNNNNA